ncbi:hypothetical protein UB31_13675 [Bradyrhizobium sp. LTSP849]|jgi:hypothetical protein|uniref:hypothetical protein n=1 Tax=unclassified Bradyrhizobium TaxID=2631580 RepID=UPI0005D21548|nr:MULTISPECIES: hypothetical protein [unclassified Bradyrhizobium]KJC43137.1 hypothetical protein UP06_21215 [Bradyrhizobium sp. LTSP857]KJC49747.1 hypothetical protein UB31_13675 [Bradyrhizobium sp. LTSP849]
MIIPTHFGPAGPLWRPQAFQAKAFQGKAWQAWAFNRVVSLDLMAVDLRLALATVVARSLVQAADALVRHVMGRAWRGARFAEDITAAATMVAAAGR